MRWKAAVLAAAFLAALSFHPGLSGAEEARPEVEVWIPWGPGGGLLGIPYGWYPQCVDFLEETSELRRELAVARFDYQEEMRKASPSPERLAELEMKVMELNERILDRAPLECGGRY